VAMPGRSNRTGDDGNDDDDESDDGGDEHGCLSFQGIVWSVYSV